MVRPTSMTQRSDQVDHARHDRPRAGPTTVPITTPISPASSPTFSVRPVPRISTASRSRPWLSVPNGVSQDGG